MNLNTSYFCDSSLTSSSLSLHYVTAKNVNIHLVNVTETVTVLLQRQGSYEEEGRCVNTMKVL